MSVILRSMRDDDLPQVSELMCACYRFLADAEGWTAEQTARVIDQRGSLPAVRMQWSVYAFFVAVDDERVVAALAIRENEVAKLFVHPLAHGRGIGTALFRFADAQIGEAGFAELMLGTTGHALGFYQRMGMRVTGVKIAGGPLAGKTITLMAKEVSAPGVRRGEIET